MIDYLSFDIEIFNDLPEGETPNLKELIPSVAAFCIDIENVEYYWDKPHMTKDTAKRLVKDIEKYVGDGYKLFGWNILSFDLPILGYYSEMIDECGKLALNCIDPMFIVICERGHYLGLDKALAGAKLETKLHTVTLNDGTVLNDMNGSRAPLLFRSGEYQAVIDYLKYDVIQPYKLAFSIGENDGIRWTSKAGKYNFLRTDLKTVKECLNIPKPDCSWMSSKPKEREEFFSWIPTKILEQELK